MRERLVILLVGSTVAVIALFGVPRAYAVADLVHETEHAQVVRAADVMAVAVSAQEGEVPVTASYLNTLREQDERLEYVGADGTRVVSGPRTTDETDFTQTRQLRGGGSITISQPDSVVTDAVSKALLPLIAVAFVVAAVSALIAVIAARRLARPFQQLAHSAGEIGKGRFDTEVPHFSIPEAERVGDSLRRASGQLDQLVRRHRDFAITSSHELRTPVTALRLSLEDLALWPQTPADVSAELNGSVVELDRLNAAITRLLEQGDAGLLGTPTDIDLTRLARAAADRWDVTARQHGRSVVLASTGVVAASVVIGPVEQIVDAMIGHALSHGAGRITVETGVTDAYLRLVVSDESPRTMATGVLHEALAAGAAGGLAVAAGLAESIDGYLRVIDASVTTVELAIPTPAVDRQDHV